MKRTITVSYFSGAFEQIEEFESDNGYSMMEEDGLLYIRIDDKARLIIPKNRLISIVEREKTP